MSFLAGARYMLALWMAAFLPPAILFWIVVHPFIGFWRRVGVGPTYWTLIPLMLASTGVLFWFHASLMAVDFGFSWVLAAPGVLIFLVGIVMDKRAKDHLKFRILAGVPELRGATDSKLLSEGLYGRMRHPRYVAIAISVMGVALLTNYLVSYVLVAVTLVGLWIVAVLEERELRQRFGEEYRIYAATVPRFIPRMRSREGGRR